MSLYFKYFNVHLKRQMEYKASFIMSFISNLIVFFSYYFSILCLFDKFNNIKGFTVYEVLLTFGIAQFGFAFCEIFFRGLDQFDDMMVAGDFDRILLRPRGVLFQLLCEDTSLVRIARLLQNVIIIVIAVIKIDVNWDISKVLVLIFMIISSIILCLSIFIFAAAYCFITIKGLEFRNLILYSSKEVVQYPIGVFGKGLIVIFTYIVPFAFVNYYPLLYILGKTKNNLLIFSPFITFIYLLFSIILFYKLLGRYKSTGS